MIWTVLEMPLSVSQVKRLCTQSSFTISLWYSFIDKGHLTIWNPLSRNIFIDEDELQINCSPEEELQEEYSDNLTFQNCSLAFGDRYILASNFSSNNVRSISLVLPVPTLKHLCRLTVRRVVPESPKLQTLKLPPRMQNYLNYDLW